MVLTKATFLVNFFEREFKFLFCFSCKLYKITSFIPKIVSEINLCLLEKIEVISEPFL